MLIVAGIRSCDLDEFTAEQLRRMSLGGNANAKTFFKSHGVSDTQMAVSSNDSFDTYYVLFLILFLYGVV